MGESRRSFPAAAACLAALLVACSGASLPSIDDEVAADASTGMVSTTGDDDASRASGMSTTPIAIDAGDCPALTYPSGTKVQTFPSATMTASYAKHLGAGEKAPTCFLDTNDLVDPDTGVVHPISVSVSKTFVLNDLVGTEVSQGYGHLVLMEPAAVVSLEKFAEASGKSVMVISGFRSPKHQEDTCNSLCGNPLGCSGTCANNSRHMFGDAFDLPLAFYTNPYETLACDDGFKFAYEESGTHLHIDQNPAYATCVKE